MVMFESLAVPAGERPQASARRLVAIEAQRRLASWQLPERVPLQAPGLPPLVALHGISRDALALWSAFSPLAAAQGRTLLVPRFAADEWPRFQQIGRQRPDLALLDLFRLAGLAGRRLDVFGFSGGAQLAHRFAMLYPHRVATLHLAAPGWYTMPDAGVHWPLGLGHGEIPRPCRFDPAALSRLQLRGYLSLRVRLWVGARDTGRDPSLRQSARLDALQGMTRLERARRYADSFTRTAREMGITPDIELTELPGCGHDFTECARVGGLAARVAQGG